MRVSGRCFRHWRRLDELREHEQFDKVVDSERDELEERHDLTLAGNRTTVNSQENTDQKGGRELLPASQLPLSQ